MIPECLAGATIGDSCPEVVVASIQVTQRRAVPMVVDGEGVRDLVKTTYLCWCDGSDRWRVIGDRRKWKEGLCCLRVVFWVSSASNQG